MGEMGGMGGVSGIRKGLDGEGEEKEGQGEFKETEGDAADEEEKSAGYHAEALESLWSVVQHVPEGSARVLPTMLSWHAHHHAAHHAAHHAHHHAAHHADGHGRPLPKELLLALIARLKERLRLVHAFEVAEHVVRSPHYWLGKDDWRLLLDVCVRAGRITRAEEMFALLPRHLQTEEVYMGILHNYARQGLVRRVESRMVMLRALGVRESALGFEARMLASGVRGLLGDVERVAREMARKGIPPSPTAYEHLMQAYARRRHLPSIRSLLRCLSHSPLPPSLPTLTAAAWAFFSRGRVGEAEGVVGQMRKLQGEKGEGLPVAVLVGLAWAYAWIGDVRRVEEVVGEVQGVRARELRILHMARIYGNAIAGQVEDAEKAFTAMQQAGHAPTTAAYNCLLLAYTRSHHMHDALSLLTTMRSSHMLPDATTYHHLITGALYNEDTDGARLAEAGEMERVERVVSEVGRGMYAMDAGMYNLVLRAVLRGARRGQVGKGVGEAGHGRRGVEGGADKGSEVVQEEDSKEDGDDGGDSCGGSEGVVVTEDVGVEEDGYERRVEEGARRVLRLLRASRIRPNVQTRIILANAGLVRLLEEEGLSGTLPR
ncbi:unnamed protein product [Closterium sp. Yama58-4]|nr:unnamed protein product [Closterium sp. Yama58-4]